MKILIDMALQFWYMDANPIFQYPKIFMPKIKGFFGRSQLLSFSQYLIKISTRL